MMPKLTNSKTGAIVQATWYAATIYAVAATFGFNLKNRIESLRESNKLSGIETFAILFGQPLCAALAYTALEIREDFILPKEENRRRGNGTKWPRYRVHETIYIEFPLFWTGTFALLLFFKMPFYVFSTYEDEPLALWGLKMVAWFVEWEFMMYWFHRLAHSMPWLYKLAHKDHHVVMDFPLGPHAPILEKLAHYVSSIIASKVVGVSAGSWVLALNILMTQCVLEHAYSSFRIPVWHDIFAFNTADLHQTHHIQNNVNFGYAFNIFDPIFGTAESHPDESPARIRFLQSARSKKD